MKIHSQFITDEQALHGSRTSVRLARDQVADQRVVIKRLETQPRISHNDLRDQLRLLHTLATSGFLDFEDVVRRDESGVEMTVRRVETTSLADAQAAAGDGAVVDVLQKVCQSVAYLHSLDYLHGDVKPDNILIEATGPGFHPYLTDLDLSIRRDVQLSRFVQGTEEYMAPEIEAGETLTESIDIYAFGRTIEAYINDMQPSGVISDLQRLAEYCTRPAIPERPVSMWSVFDTLERLGRVHCRRRRAGLMPPPLRPAGLAQRVDRLKRVLSPDDDPRTGLCLLRAPRGGGASRIMRELCLNLQWEGAMTLRVTHVTSLADLLTVLPQYIRSCRQQAPQGRTPILWVFVETERMTDVQSSLWTEFNELAIQQSCVIVCEGHRIPAVDIPTGCRHYDANLLTPRECVIATGHLIDNPAVASANERSLAIAARGHPGLVQMLMRRSLEVNRLRTHLEPVNIDETDPRILEPWQDEYRLLPVGQRTVLEAASVFHERVPLGALSRVVEDSTCLLEDVQQLVRIGWLAEERRKSAAPTYRLCCRTARNAIRHMIGPARLRQMARHHIEREVWRDAVGANDLFEEWSLRGLIGETVTDDERAIVRRGPGDIVDIKLVLCQMVRHYRWAQSTDARQRLEWAADLAVGFAALGSVRRQQAWARRALVWCD
ncbi:MAG: protein kinase, partial [candidate division Zixibacteria bacterium]|nr:protein kinase [candidate division Zixibacteria bacterium]